jgi:hypothetical protein
MASHITLRPATIADLPTLEYWDTQEHTIHSDPNDDWNWAEELRRFPEWREPPGAGRIVAGILEHSEVRRLFRICAVLLLQS